MLDFNKLRYDLALHAATARLIKYGYDNSFENDCEALLGFFAVCYKDATKISDQDIKELLSSY